MIKVFYKNFINVEDGFVFYLSLAYLNNGIVRRDDFESVRENLYNENQIKKFIKSNVAELQHKKIKLVRCPESQPIVLCAINGGLFE